MIASITLENFKSFEKNTVPLGNLTLLSGFNGAGKSTLIQAILLLRQSASSGALNQNSLSLNGELIQLGTGQDVLFEFASSKSDSMLIALDWTDKSSAKWRIKYAAESDFLTSALESALSWDVIREKFPFTDRVQYLSADRLGPRVSYPAPVHFVKEKKSLGSRGQYTTFFLSSVQNENIPIPSLGHPKAVSASIIHQVEAWLSEICPGVRLNPEHYPKIDSSALRFSFQSEKTVSLGYRAVNVGFGLSYALPILVAALSAQQDSLLILENPEAHLHPRGQTRLGELLATAAQQGVQVIVESHSDHFLNGIRLAAKGGKIDPKKTALHFFERKSEETKTYSTFSTPTLDSNGRLDDWPAGFFDEWENTLSTIL